MATFTGKVALVTGGTGGIGKATAVAFAREGAKVVLSGRREKEGLAVVEEITKAGGVAHFVAADVAKEADVKRLVGETVAKFGRLDVAFNNAGVEWAGPLTEATEADYRRVFDINVWGVLTAMKYEVPAMLKGGGGAIVNTSSIAGHIGFPGASVYAAAKFAVEGLTKTAALEFARQGVRVNAVAPAAIVTEMVDRFFGGEDSEGGKAMAEKHPVGRMGRPEEVAAAVLYLASDAAKFTTGVSLPVDGGWLAQ
ncbi:MAG: short chain dehydrogenase [Isosphaera sp.]|nr:short chain dehydrogenase [Isosphaera sp.]